ncbi:MAG: extracellular solute-binding protein [Bacilli bacterium]|jgi:ABC-type glycerol-3-phosphate transport system substrate-binding protein
MKAHKNLLLLFAVASASLFGCGPSSGVLQIALDAEDEGRYDELFAYFTEQSGYQISATYGQDISKLIGTKDEPDIIKTSTVVVSSMKDSLRDLTPLISASQVVDTANYIDSLMNALTIDGKVYALPTSVNTSLLYYNKTLFDASENELRSALGLSLEESVYPKSDWDYADYQTAGITLSKYTNTANGPRYSQYGAETQLTWWGEWLVYVNQMGGSFYEEDSDNHVCALTSPEAIEATTFFRDKAMGDVTKKFAPDAIELTGDASFMGGNIAMIFGGHIGDWYSYDALGLDWDVQLLPTPVGIPDARGGEISADAFGISKRSDNVQGAFAFLELWTGEEGALQMYKYGKIGALKAMESLIAGLPASEQKDLSIGVVFDAMEKALTLPDERDFSKVMREIVMSEIYLLMFEGRGAKSDVVEVLTTIKEKVDNYYRGLYGG